METHMKIIFTFIAVFAAGLLAANYLVLGHA
jgi:hypothetical protein